MFSLPPHMHYAVSLVRRGPLGNNSGTEKQPKEKVFVADIPRTSGGQKASSRPLKHLKEKHMGADIHGPNAWTSMTPERGSRNFGLIRVLCNSASPLPTLLEGEVEIQETRKGRTSRVQEVSRDRSRIIRPSLIAPKHSKTSVFWPLSYP